MAMTVHVDIVSAEQSIFSGLAQSLSATGSLGELGITPGHAPLLTALVPGQVKLLTHNGDTEWFYIDGGMLEVQPDVVTVLADTATRAADLDEAEALRAKERAEQAMQDKQADFDYSAATAELARAAAQLRTIRQLRGKLKK